MFKDTSDGQTHSQDGGCGEKEHNTLHPDYSHCSSCSELIHKVGGEERGHEANCERLLAPPLLKVSLIENI